MRPVLILAALFGALTGQALAFDPCSASRYHADNASQASLIRQAHDQAKNEGLTEGSQEFTAREAALKDSPTSDMQAQADADVASAQSALALCAAAAAKAPSR